SRRGGARRASHGGPPPGPGTRPRAGASLSPPRLAQRRAGPARATGSAVETSVDALAATAPPTRTRPARMAAPATSRLGARPRPTSSRSSRTRGAPGPLHRREPPELDEDARVDRLEDVRMLGRVTLVQPGQGGLDLARRVGDTLVLRQRPIRPSHDPSRDGSNPASIGGPERSPAAHGCG